MPTVHAERLFEADPTSAALLLAGPTAIDCWPAGLEVRSAPPLRTPTAYVTRFDVSGAGLPTTSGVLALTYEPRGLGESATSAIMRLDWSLLEREGRWVDRMVAGRALREIAERFLANLAVAAEGRSRAA